MPILATLCFALLQAVPVELRVCDACVPDSVCEQHRALEWSELPTLLERYRALAIGAGVGLEIQVTKEQLAADPELITRLRREFAEERDRARAERERVLASIAALNRERGNAPSPAVTAALAEGLSDFSSQVRASTASLLVDGQHAETAVAALCDALGNLEGGYDAIGGGFARRLKRLDAPSFENGDADADGLDVRGLREALDRWLRDIHLELEINKLISIGRGIPPLAGTMPEAEYKRRSARYAREKAEGERAYEKFRKEWERKREQVEALRNEVDAAQRALDVAPALATALGSFGEERARRTVERHFDMLVKTCPTRSVPAARALLAAGTAGAFGDVVAALGRRGNPPEERIGPVDVSASSHEEWRRALHDALTAAAAAREIAAPAWSDDVDDAWEAWLEAHAGELPEDP